MKKTLGIKDSERFGPSYAISPVGGKKGKDPITFPSIELVGPQIEALGLGDAKIGDKFMAEVCICVTRNEARRDDQNPEKKVHRMSIELEDALKPAEPCESEESEDESEPEMSGEKEPEPDTEEEEPSKSVRGKKKADRGDSVSPSDSGLEDDLD